MNMKSLFALAAISAVGATSAAVTTGNTLCRIEVNSGTTNTIVAVPLVKIDQNGGAIPVDKLVLTDNLANGDTLLHWNASANEGNGVWEAWVVANSVWTPVSVVDGMQAATVTAGASDATLTRGDAIWVNRTFSGTSTPFYLYGQVTAGSATATTLARGTATTNAYTMVGNPLTEEKAVNSLTFTGGINTGDAIVWGNSTSIGGVKELTYDGKEWGSFTTTKATLPSGLVVNQKSWTCSTDSIPAGQGFWYVSKGGTGTLTVAW